MSALNKVDQDILERIILAFANLACQGLLSDNQCVSKVSVLGEGTQGLSGISQLPLAPGYTSFQGDSSGQRWHICIGAKEAFLWKGVKTRPSSLLWFGDEQAGHSADSKRLAGTGTSVANGEPAHRERNVGTVSVAAWDDASLQCVQDSSGLGDSGGTMATVGMKQRKV